MSVASGCYKPSKNGSKGKKQASAGKLNRYSKERLRAL